MKDKVLFMEHNLLKLYNLFMQVLFALVICMLIIMSMVSTSFIDVSEKTYFVKDSLCENILSVIIFILVCVLFRKKIIVWNNKLERDDRYFYQCRKFLLWIIIFSGFVWIISTQFIPGSDQEALQNAVSLMRNGNYSMYGKEEYLARNPHQLGLVWIYYGISVLIGSQNIIGLQLLNVLGITWIYNRISAISERMGMSRGGQLAVILCGILFFPLIMYSSFIYGNILGLSFALESIYQAFLFWKNDKKINLVYSAFFMALATVVKSNYQIFMIALMIVSILQAIYKRRKKLVLFPVIVLIICLSCSKGIILISEKISGTELQGASYWGYIAMGLQDSDERAPGWYNGYIQDSYIENNFDKNKQAEMAKENIRKQLEYYAENDDDAIKFFMEKTASQWNNPTFQSYNIIQWRPSLHNKPEWINKLISIRGEDRAVVFLKFFQIIVLFGSVVYCVLYWNKDRAPLSSIWILTFIGGFIFHLFWEAKGQYTISYFVLLFPCAIQGYAEMITTINLAIEERKLRKRNIERNKKKRNFVLKISVLSIILLTEILMFGENIAYLEKDSDIYYEMVEAGSYK